MSGQQWAGIAVIAIVVLRLWDIPVGSAAPHASGDGSDIWMQFLAYSMMHVLLGAIRARRAAKGSRQQPGSLSAARVIVRTDDGHE